MRYKEVFNELFKERTGKIYNISKETNFINFKGSNTAPINFTKFGSPRHIYNEIKNCNISI